MGERRRGESGEPGTGCPAEAEDAVLRRAVALLQSSYLHSSSRQGFRYSRASLVENERFLSELKAFARAKRAAGYSPEELQETFAFLLFDKEEEAKEVCQTGLRVNSSSISTLGDPAKGVYISKHADCLQPWPHGEAGYIVICKLIKGKVRVIAEDSTAATTCPSPGYDCHVSQHSQSQYYVYEVLGGSAAERPRQVCPYIALACHYRDPGDSPAQSPAERRHRAVSWFCPWRGQLSIRGRRLCSIALRTPHSPTIPAQLPPNLDINHVMGLSDLRKKIPEAAFGKKNYTENEVCFQGVYSSLYEVEISNKDQHKMDQLVEKLKEKDLAIIKYLQDQGVLILLTSSALAREDGLEPKEPVSLLALFLFTSPRALGPRAAKQDPKDGRESSDRNDISLKIASVLPGIRYALRKAAGSSRNSAGSAWIERHLREFAKLREHPQPTPGWNSDVAIPPLQDEGPQKLPERSLSHLRRYLCDPGGYSLGISAALECLRGANPENSCPERGGEGPPKDVTVPSTPWGQQSRRKSSRILLARRNLSPLEAPARPAGEDGRGRESAKKKISVASSFPKKSGSAGSSSEPMLKLANLQLPHGRKRGAEVLAAEIVHKSQSEAAAKEPSAPDGATSEAKRPKTLENAEVRKAPGAESSTRAGRSKTLRSLESRAPKPPGSDQERSARQEPLPALPSAVPSRSHGAEIQRNDINDIFPTGAPGGGFALRGDNSESHALNLLADLALGSCVPAFVPRDCGATPVSHSPSLVPRDCGATAVSHSPSLVPRDSGVTAVSHSPAFVPRDAGVTAVPHSPSLVPSNCGVTAVSHSPPLVPRDSGVTAVPHSPSLIPRDAGVTPVPHSPSLVPSNCGVTAVSCSPPFIPSDSGVTAVPHSPSLVPSNCGVTAVSHSPPFVPRDSGVTPVSPSPPRDPREQRSPSEHKSPRSASDHKYHRADRHGRRAAPTGRACQSLELPEKTDSGGVASPAREKTPGISMENSVSPSPAPLPPREAPEAAEVNRHSIISAEHSYASPLPENPRKHPNSRGNPNSGPAPSRNGTRSAPAVPLVGKVLPFRHQHSASEPSRCGSSARKKEDFAKTHTVNVCGNSMKVTCRWEEEYLFSLDSRYTKDSLEKTVIRALHGPWDPDLPDDVEGMKLIFHMWVALFYRKPSKLLSSSRMVVEHSNPRKYVSINSTGGFLELSDDSQDCFGFETCAADSGSDPDQTPSSSLDPSAPSQGASHPEKSPADSQTDADGAAGAVDSTVSSSSGELPCGEEEEPSSTSCPESLSLADRAQEGPDGADGEPEVAPEEGARDISSVTAEEPLQEDLLDATTTPSPSEELPSKPPDAETENPCSQAPNSSSAPRPDPPCELQEHGGQQESPWAAGSGSGPGPPEDGQGVGDAGHCPESEDTADPRPACDSVPLETSPQRTEPGGAPEQGEEPREPSERSEKEEREMEEGKEENEDFEDENSCVGAVDLVLSESSDTEMECEHGERNPGNSASPEELGVPEEDPVPCPTSLASPCPDRATPALSNGPETDPGAFPAEMSPSQDELPEPWDAPATSGSETDGIGVASPAGVGSPCSDSGELPLPPDPSPVHGAQPDSVTDSSGPAGDTLGNGPEQENGDPASSAERWEPAGGTAGPESPRGHGLALALSPDSSSVCLTSPDGSVDPWAAPEDQPMESLQSPSQSDLGRAGCFPQACRDDGAGLNSCQPRGADLNCPDTEESSQGGNGVLGEEQDGDTSANGAEVLDEPTGAAHGRDSPFDYADLGDDPRAEERDEEFSGAENSPGHDTADTEMAADTPQEPEIAPHHHLLESEPSSSATEGISAAQELPRPRQSFPSIPGDSAPASPAGDSDPPSPAAPSRRESVLCCLWKPRWEGGAAPVSAAAWSPAGSPNPSQSQEVIPATAPWSPAGSPNPSQAQEEILAVTPYSPDGFPNPSPSQEEIPAVPACSPDGFPNRSHSQEVIPATALWSPDGSPNPRRSQEVSPAVPAWSPDGSPNPSCSLEDIAAVAPCSPDGSPNPSRSQEVIPAIAAWSPAGSPDPSRSQEVIPSVAAWSPAGSPNPNCSQEEIAAATACSPDGSPNPSPSQEEIPAMAPCSPNGSPNPSPSQEEIPAVAPCSPNGSPNPSPSQEEIPAVAPCSPNGSPNPSPSQEEIPATAAWSPAGSPNPSQSQEEIPAAAPWSPDGSPDPSRSQEVIPAAAPWSPDGSPDPSRSPEEILAPCSPADEFVPGVPGSAPPSPCDPWDDLEVGSPLPGALPATPDSARWSGSCARSPEQESLLPGDVQGGSSVPSPAPFPEGECHLWEPWDMCEHSAEGSEAFPDPDCAGSEEGEAEIPASPIAVSPAHRDPCGDSLELSDAEEILDRLPREEQLPSPDRHEGSAFDDPLENSFGDSEREFFEGNSPSPPAGRSCCIMSSMGAAGARTTWGSSRRSPVPVGEDWDRDVPRDRGGFVVTRRCQDRTESVPLRRHSRRAQEPPLFRSLLRTWRGAEEMTQNTLDMECLRFHYKLKQILRSGRPAFSTSRSIFPKEFSPRAVSPLPPSPRSRSPLQVTVSPSDTRPGGLRSRRHRDSPWDRRRAESRGHRDSWDHRDHRDHRDRQDRCAPFHLGKLRYERSPPDSRGDVAVILDEYSEFQRVVLGRAGAGAEGTAWGEAGNAQTVPARPGRTAAFPGMIAELCGALRSHLRRVALGQPGMFYLLETGTEPFFDRAKALLKEEGLVRVEPLSFCAAKRQDSERLLVIVRNEDIAAHVHSVPCLLELKCHPGVVFAGVDDPEDVTGDTFQELFQAGGFVVSDKELLERVTLGWLKELVKALERLNRSGRWKWLLHYSESKKLQGDLRDDAQKKRLLLKWCQGEDLLELLPFHSCDGAGAAEPRPTQCLLQLQAQRVGARFAVYLTENPDSSRESLESKGILVADINTFLGTLQEVAAPFRRSYW